MAASSQHNNREGGHLNGIRHSSSDSSVTFSDSVDVSSQATTASLRHHVQLSHGNTSHPRSTASTSASPYHSPHHHEGWRTATANPQDIPAATPPWNNPITGTDIKTQEKRLPHPKTLPRNFWQPKSNLSMCNEPVIRQVSSDNFDAITCKDAVVEMGEINQQLPWERRQQSVGSIEETGEEDEDIYDVPRNVVHVANVLCY